MYTGKLFFVLRHASLKCAMKHPFENCTSNAQQICTQPLIHAGVHVPRTNRLNVLRHVTGCPLSVKFPGIDYLVFALNQYHPHNICICLNNCLFCQTLLTHWIYGVLWCNGIKRSRTRIFTFSLYLNLENSNMLCRGFTHNSRIHYHGPRFRFGNKM